MEERITIINIFDFDGTIFKSPVPNPETWDNPSIGRLTGTVDSHGLGWYQDPVTLEHPYVPGVPDENWFVPHIKDTVLNSMKDPDCITALLTGRNIKHADRIKIILESAGLKFEEYGFKPTSDGSVHTLPFKKEFIARLVKTYKPKKINIWDDRVKHAEEFQQYLSTHLSHLESKVYLVDPPGETYLPREVELELVKVLKNNSKNDILWEEQVLYTAVILDDESIALLKKEFPPIPGWKEYYHHMTICLGSLNNQNSQKFTTLITNLGDTVQLEIVAVGRDNQGYAVEVKGIPSINSRPHITMCTSPGSVPRCSNDITYWQNINQTITLTGTISEKTKFILKREKRDKYNNNKTTESINIANLILSLTSLRGKQVSAAISEVTRWMKQNSITNHTDNQPQVVKYITENIK